MDELRNECCFILYGAAYVGKTFLVNNIKGSTEIIDCTQMGTLVSSLDSIDTLLEYLQLKLARVLDDPEAKLLRATVKPPKLMGFPGEAIVI